MLFFLGHCDLRILCQTPAKAEFTMGMPASGREYLSLVAKSTYAFPEAKDAEPVHAAEQRDLVMADEYSGDPGYSATVWETDFALRKPRCDVIANAAAYAPNGQPTDRVRVGIRVGQMVKQFDVVGSREWRALGPSLTSTRPHPFTKMAFSYDTAFGGVEKTDPDDPMPPAYDSNPVGLGFAAVRDLEKLIGQPLPNTEDPDHPVLSPFDNHQPLALGPIGRGWPLRRRYAGTYDQDWIDNVFPFLPRDFDEKYYQMAPEDQQIDPPRRGTEIVIVGMTRSGREAFRLPETALPIRVFRGRETAFQDDVLPDTLAIDTEARVFMLTWRICIPIKRDITEFTEAWVGKPTDAMLKAHREGRTYIRAVAAGPVEEADA